MSRNPERTAALGLIWGAFPEHIARRLLLAIASPAVLAEFEELAATRHARALLDKGIERRSIAYRLRAAYRLSSATAYRRISAALNLPRNLYHGRPDDEN